MDYSNLRGNFREVPELSQSYTKSNLLYHNDYSNRFKTLLCRTSFDSLVFIYICRNFQDMPTTKVTTVEIYTCRWRACNKIWSLKFWLFCCWERIIGMFSYWKWSLEHLKFRYKFEQDFDFSFKLRAILSNLKRKICTPLQKVASLISEEPGLKNFHGHHRFLIKIDVSNSVVPNNVVMQYFRLFDTKVNFVK